MEMPTVRDIFSQSFIVIAYGVLTIYVEIAWIIVIFNSHIYSYNTLSWDVYNFLMCEELINIALFHW